MMIRLTDKLPVVLDVTLRDGGYLNDWCFSDQAVMKAVATNVLADVDVIEIGYCDDLASLPEAAGCPPKMIRRIRSQVGESIILAGMIRPNVDDPAQVLEKRAGLIDLLRIPVDVSSPHRAISLAQQCLAHGFQVTLNFTSVSSFSLERIAAVTERVPQEVAAIYLADSRGAVRVEEVPRIVSAVRSKWTGAIGYHAHNNLGLAIETSRSALLSGCTWIDGSIAGVGIGGRNLRLEDAIALASEHRDDLSPDEAAFLVSEADLGLAAPGAEYRLFQLAGQCNIRQEWVLPLIDRLGSGRTLDLLTSMPRRPWFCESDLEPFIAALKQKEILDDSNANL